MTKTPPHHTLWRGTAAAVTLLCAAATQAQTPVDSQVQMLGGPMRHDMLFMAGAQLERERVVQNAPYCADAVHESVQSLVDGNRIVQRQASRQCRDGQGRTRQEVMGPGGRRNVFVRDPVAHESWMLDLEGKRAVRLDAPRRTGGGADTEPSATMLERLLGLGRDLRERLRPGKAPTAAPPPDPATSQPEPVRIAIPGAMGDGPPPPRMFAPPPMPFPMRLPGPRGVGVVTILPADAVEGLRADGKRTTWTIEAGRIGNERPIVIVNETWNSPELGITLRSRDADPLAGEENYRVQNVTRGEPDAQLFRVPADFTKVSPPTFTIPLPPSSAGKR
ncbi:hypothetical protein [Caenimonas koreensis]|uniref:hypothetical protein n=1 Tax=Caenimonas koreensis TaxID=367474 RepID=UPI003782E4AF